MSPPPQRPARPPGTWRWAGLLAALLLAVSLGAWLLPPDGVLTECERDGHFQRMGQIACGLVPANAPWGPLLPWLGAALTPIAGTPYLAGRVLGLLSLLGMVGLTWWAAMRFGPGAGAAALAAILVGANPHLLLSGTMACTDMPASLLWLLALYLASASVEEPDRAWRPATAGVFGALAVLVRVQWLLPVVALMGLMVLFLPGGWRLRVGRAGLFLAGLALPLGIAIAVGHRHYPDLQGVLGEYLGGLAFTRAIPRLGALAAGAPTAEGAPGLGARLAWGVWLAVRVSGGLPLIALVAAFGMSLGRWIRSWRAVVLVTLAAGACWAATAWSHPPPDLGARRFFLALVAPGIVVGVALLAGLGRRAPRWVAWAGAVALVAGAAGFLVGEIEALRGVEARPGRVGLPRPLDRSSEVDRAALRAGRRLLAAEDPGCAPVYTNYHNAAVPFANPRFLGDGDLRAAVAALPALPPGSRAYLLWVSPPGADDLVPPRVPGGAAELLEIEAGVAIFRWVPAGSGDAR